jgi:triacylglycerol esterase/lipase EstA (alpha/beta hydrolase family)
VSALDVVGAAGVLLFGLVAVAVALWVAWVLVTILLRIAVDGGAPGLWAASFTDIGHALRVVSWRLRGRGVRGAPSDDPGIAVGSDVVVVLLHGTAADGTCMRAWAAAVAAAGVEAPILAPDHGMFLRTPEVHGERIAKVLRACLAQGPRVRLVIVAHSLGGLAVRCTLASDATLRARTLGVITVATPHRGTALAKRLPVGPLAFLALDNDWVRALPMLTDLVPRVRSIATDVDVIVYPPATCVAGEHELLHGIGHAHLLTSPLVAGRVADAVRAVIVDAGRVP